ncbi:MAG TPA: superoxide dismutase [Prolixibacteraceae bacterium]|nr:superoxide dismutase [Prolixibacteraceae bacterium]
MPAQKAIDSVFPELPYAFNALEPNIDAKTMEIHYTKHHKGYFNNFMAAIKDTPAAEMDMNELFAGISKQSAAVKNNAGGYYNHMLFWENMTPSKTAPSVVLNGLIEKSFGSMDKFKEEFSNAAKKQFGSGWAWLVAGKDGQLFVSATANQENPLMDVVEKKGTPLLCLDVWEHAYYLHYQNRRAEYVDNFWNVVNWDTVNKRYANR